MKAVLFAVVVVVAGFSTALLLGGWSYPPPTTTTITTGTTTVPPPTETTPPPTTTTPPPSGGDGSGAASVFCDFDHYVVTGTVDGQAIDSASPATIAGTYLGWTNVVLTRGDTSVRSAVFTYGDCVPPTR